MVVYEPVTQANRERVTRFLEEEWGSQFMAVRGCLYDLNTVDGILAAEDGNLLGLITYLFHDGYCEIMSLNSLRENCGIGSQLISRTAGIARKAGCGRLVVVTTNDNIEAICFYQKRGFDLAELRRNALELSRKLKPQIPLTGNHGIPLKHELEFELVL